MSNAKTPKTLDVSQQQKLLDFLRSKVAPQKTFVKGVRNHLMACLMLDAGLRVGEVVKLKMSHAYFLGAPVECLLLTPDITKNHRERTVHLSTRLQLTLTKHYNVNPWLHRRPDTYSIWGKENHDKPPTTRQVENVINNAGMKALGRPVNPHMLRHTFASSLLRVTNMRTVQQLLGHNYITSTQIYTHPNEDDKKQAIEKMSSNETSH